MSASPSKLTRSQLFVPASRMDMIEKAAKSSADMIIIDLEDSVAPIQKEASRDNVIEALQNIDFGVRVRMFRINALDTSYAYHDVIDIVEQVGENVDLIMLPKVQSQGDLQFLDTLLTQVESHVGLTNTLGIEAQIESASGYLNLKEIGGSSNRLESVIFGPGDYASSMQMPLEFIGEADSHDAVYPGHRWHAVMHTLVAVARANGLRCVDGPYADFKDEEGFENACRIALAMGYDGKQCIHPSQLAIANRIFSPSKSQISRAEAILEAYEEALAEGTGAISLDGKMIDQVNLRLAENTLNKFQAIKEKEDQTKE
jgi:citrate lyase subunit beta/citryl-CoA lyase